MEHDLPEDLGTATQAQLSEWMAELEILSRDPRVRKFTELRQRIDEADILFGGVTPPAPSQTSPFDPYGAYDAFEFARDLAGQVVSPRQLAKLARDRFPEWTNERRRFMVHYLIENGVAEVTRVAASGRVTGYRFGSPANGGIEGIRKRFGVPANELSSFKAEDLEDVLVRPPQAQTGARS